MINHTIGLGAGPLRQAACRLAFVFELRRIRPTRVFVVPLMQIGDQFQQAPRSGPLRFLQTSS